MFIIRRVWETFLLQVLTHVTATIPNLAVILRYKSKTFNCAKKISLLLMSPQSKTGREQNILGLNLQSRSEAVATKILPAQNGSGQRERDWENNWK